MKGTLAGLSIYVCLLTTTVHAQRSEVGAGVGTFNYTGDLVKFYNFRYSKPAVTVFYRSNISNVVSFRASVTGGKIGATDNSQDPLGAVRNASFNIFLMEVAGVAEYHFMNWRETKRFVRFSPYFFAGLGLFGISGNIEKQEEYSNIQGTIPFGAGLKYVYTPKLYFSLEFGVRKTFFDHLDNISGGDTGNKAVPFGNPNTNDAYYFFGITVTRTFYNVPCPRSPYK